MVSMVNELLILKYFKVKNIFLLPIKALNAKKENKKFFKLCMFVRGKAVNRKF